MTNTAKIAKIINVTKFKTQKKRRQDGPRNVHKNRKFYKDFFLLYQKTPMAKIAKIGKITNVTKFKT